MSTPILRWTARALTPVIVVVSLYFLLRGHNSPGGGFIAALVAGSAVVLQYLAHGLDGVRRFIPVRFATLLSLGLVIAVVSGLVPLAFGGAFLEQTTFDIGDLHLSSSLAFDIGVYLVVLSVVVVIVRYLGERP
ncbi:MAG TPA: MnhB domain-containing protein [Actinomycetota bacterium]|nr:MnhB domain-containing protein [Actinomycetota bacterium]